MSPLVRWVFAFTLHERVHTLSLCLQHFCSPPLKQTICALYPSKKVPTPYRTNYTSKNPAYTLTVICCMYMYHQAQVISPSITLANKTHLKRGGYILARVVIREQCLFRNRTAELTIVVADRARATTQSLGYTREDTSTTHRRRNTFRSGAVN